MICYFNYLVGIKNMTISLKPIATGKPDQISLLLIQGFSMLPFASLIDPFRMANRLSGKTLYQWHLISVDGEAVSSSGNIALNVDGAIDNIIDSGIPMDNLFICGGVHIQQFNDRRVLNFIQRMGRSDNYLGAICTGSYLLARAGVLNGYRCTIHWENLDAFRENFPDLDSRASLYEFDRNRLTCCGSTAAFEMSVRIIKEKHGTQLADDICEQFIQEKKRHYDDDNNLLPIRVRLQVNHQKLVKAISAMEDNCEKTISREEIADIAGISCRQLERLFYQHIGTSPRRYYLKIRLERAKRLLQQTNLSIAEIAFACGFNTASHFSRCFHNIYGFTPRSNR